MHSCGKVNELIEPLIEIGLDIINLQQPRALGIEEIGRRYRGRICFESTCDIQATLPRGDAAAVTAEAEELVANWSTPEGGFIVFNYGFDEAIGTTREATEVMFHEFAEQMHRWGE